VAVNEASWREFVQLVEQTIESTSEPGSTEHAADENN